MALIYSSFMLLVLTTMIALLFGMIGRRWPDLMRALMGQSHLQPARVQAEAMRRLIRA